MPNRFRNFAHAALERVRQMPLVHGPVHQLALLLEKTPLGERLIRSVLEPDAQIEPTRYQHWIKRHDTLSDDDRAAIVAHIGRMAKTPLISVVMPAYATPVKLLREAIASVQAQIYPHWELCIADDASPGQAVWKVLSDAAAADPRIKIVRRKQNGHISAATNSALALATGEFVALMDHDDLLPERALYEVAAVLDRHLDADLIYSDEDKIDDDGRRFEPYLKTDWNYDLLLGQNMVSHLGVYRRALLNEVGGLREGFEGSQDYDLALRIAERTTADKIHHIPWVLYHWRQQGETASFSESFLARCADSAQRAVSEHLERTGQAGCDVISLEGMPGWVRVKRPLPSPAPLVTAIVPTRDRADLMEQCARGFLEDTDYPSLELLIVDNGSEEPETHALFDRLRQDPRVRILDAPGPFNFSALNNRAAAEAKGEILLLLNNDIEMREPGWLAELVAHAVRPNVGAAGAKLLYPDGKVQHGGVLLGIGVDKVAGHCGHLLEGHDPGPFGRLAIAGNASAVTGACLAMRREVFEQVGGLDEARLKVSYNDVDLCLKVRAAGYDIVWTPWAELVHHESASRGLDHAGEKRERFLSEVAVMRERWGPLLDNDPFFGPCLDNLCGDFRLADPPTRTQPWVAADA